jgi:hypothetical protein
MPFSILLLEDRKERKKILRLLLAAGLLLAGYHAYSLIYFRVSIRIGQHHIQYLISQPSWMRAPANVFYGAAGILPVLVSSVRRMWWLGLFLLISYLFAFLYFHPYIVSVWCYYATFISIMVYLGLRHLQKPADSCGMKGNVFSQ